MKLIQNLQSLNKKINKKLRIELANLIRKYLKKYDHQTYGEIYKLFQSVDYMRDNIRKQEGLTNQTELENLINEVEQKVDEFTLNYLALPKK